MIRKREALLAAALCALIVPAFAENDSSSLFDTQAAPAAAADTKAAAQASTFDLGLSGDHEFDYHMPLDSANYNYDGAMKSPVFKNNLGIEVQDGQVKLVSHWEGDISPNSYNNTANGQYDVANGYAVIKPLENYISWNPAAFKLAFGYQIFSWGVADKVNPTDNLNPRDFTVGWNADKIPVLAADATWYLTDNLALEGVFLPYKQASIYPVNYASELYGNSSLASLGASSTDVSYASLAYTPYSSVGGGKLNFNSSALDASVSYLYDLDSFYTPEISVTQTATSEYKISSISLDRRRIQRFGADAKTTLGKFGLWFEGAYNYTDNSGSNDYSVRKSNFAYVLGTDVNYGPDDRFYVNLQYIGTWIPGYDASSTSDYNSTTAQAMALYGLYGATASSASEFYQRQTVNMLGLETEGLLQGVTCNLKWEFLDGMLTPQVTAIYTMPFFYDSTSQTRYGDLGINPEIDLKPVDSFHIKLGADLAYAWVKNAGSNDITLNTTTDKLGSYTQYNNLYLSVLYKWNYDLKK